MTLSNDKQIHSVLIKLDKDIPRERALRQFLDDAVSNGINRKEAILRLFEEYNGSNPLQINNIDQSINKVNIDENTQSNKNMTTIKANNEITDVSAFDE